MSADLFAEFNAPPPSSASNQPQPPKSSNPGFSSVPEARDPFDFLSTSNQANLTPQSQQESSPSWPTFPSQLGNGQQSRAGSQGNSLAQSSYPSRTQPEDADGDDGWGDFEVAQPSTLAKQEPSSLAKGPAASVIKAAQRPPGRLVRASTLDIINNNLVDTGFSSPYVPESTKPSPRKSKLKPRVKDEPTDPSVIFDVADFELQDDEGDGSENGSDDEFGDFEAVVSAKPQPAAQTARHVAPPAMDLLLLDNDPKPTSQSSVTSQATKTASVNVSFGATKPGQHQHSRGPSNSRPLSSTARKTAPKPTAVAKPVVENDDADEWGDWDDLSPKPQVNSVPSESKAQADSWDWDAVSNSNSPMPGKTAAADEPPPVNVPPPSVLLSAFPALLNSGSDFFKPISGSNTSLKQRVLSDPKASEFLRGYVLLAVTAGRIIAGRKQRWHRDKILAKSMSLSAAGSKGMKLAGVDKTQSAREDREAADVTAVWRENVGRLRSAVTAANSAGQAPLKVPELSDTLTIQTAKQAPTAPKPCVICGLKREERVAKVDHEVEDSFGEWWVDHWGHRACKNFWIQHEVTLRQR